MYYHYYGVHGGVMIDIWTDVVDYDNYNQYHIYYSSYGVCVKVDYLCTRKKKTRAYRIDLS